MNNKSIKSHWENIYTKKLTQELSWYQQEPTISLEVILRFAKKDNSIIDIGGGTSVLIERLLQKGYANLALLDISSKAIEHVKNRVSDQISKVEWFEKDITEFAPPHNYDIWHDRAVFHFLTDIKARKLYINGICKKFCVSIDNN